jgi:hypothetical protein
MEALAKLIEDETRGAASAPPAGHAAAAKQDDEARPRLRSSVP